MTEISEATFVKAYKEIFDKFPLISSKIKKILPKLQFDKYMKISEKSIEEKTGYFEKWQAKKNLGVLMKYFLDSSGNLPYYTII